MKELERKNKQKTEPTAENSRTEKTNLEERKKKKRHRKSLLAL
jgi:hypothetical protein